MSMDSARFTALWEYTIPSKTRATADGLFRVSMMYLGDAKLTDADQAELRKGCETCIQAAPEEITNKELLKHLLADTAFTALLAAKLLLKTPSAPNTSALKSILDNVDEEEEDSSVNSQSDDEDEASSSEEEEEEQASAAAPQDPVVMKGFIKLNGEKVEWTGSWALNAQAFEAGDKAKFRYETHLDGGFEFSTGAAAATRAPASSSWDGSFLIKDATASGGFVRVDESGVIIEFAPKDKEANKWTLRGRGSNAHGTFTLEGELDGASRRMALLKTIKFHPATGSSKKKSRRTQAPSSEDEVEEDEDELDPTELADLERDQREHEMATNKKQRRN